MQVEEKQIQVKLLEDYLKNKEYLQKKWNDLMQD